MNKFEAVLEDIVSLERLNLLKFKTEKEYINVIILEMNLNLKKGDKAILGVKPTKCFLLPEKVPFENCLKVKIKEITKGKILSNVVCEFEKNEFEVIMLNDFADINEEAFLVFKASDISIIEAKNAS
jgi:molybdopterin-binding protein